jgi:RNA polymerase sigma factor (sigma-70 family)
MPQAQLSCLVRNLRQVVNQPARNVPDGELLARFVREQDEAAFEMLLRRHERMVLAVCRRILASRQDAEDAFQATFLALACKAGSIGNSSAVASWLYKVAHRVAWRSRASAHNRLEHERRAGSEQCSQRSAGESDGRADAQAANTDLRNVLHEEVSRLPEKYRTPVVLCYLEGQTNEQAGAQLSCPPGTVATRLARARQRLRNRLGRRGLGLSSAALAAALCQDAGAAVLPAVRETIIRAAVVFAANPAASGQVSTQVANLTRGVLKAMFMTKVKIIAAVVFLSVGLIGTGSGLWAYREGLPAAFAGETREGLWQEQDQDQDQPRSRRRRAEPAQKPVREAEKPKHRDRDEMLSVQEVVSKSFKTGKSPRVVVELYNGGIEVNAGSKSGVEARVIKKGRGKTEEEAKEALAEVDLKMTQDGDTVRIEATRPHDGGARHRSSGASAELTVPAGAKLELQTKNGGVHLNGGTGKVQVKTSNGAIEAKGSRGPLHLNTSNGAIRVEDATGRLELKTSNGPVEIHGDKVIVQARTSNGAVRFGGGLAAGEHSLHTSNGAIELALPSSASFHVHAHTSHGTVKSEFGKGDQASGKGKMRMDIEIGDRASGTKIELHTSNGGITIRRQGEEPEQREQQRDRKRPERRQRERQDSERRESDG